MHYYKRNIGDYSKKAGRLTMLQHGAYTLLLDSCYDRERFPTLEEAIEWTWASTESEVEAVKFVLNRFFKLDNDGQYVQDRILDELLHYHKNADTNKRIAIEREAKRKEKSTEREQSVNEPPPNHKPLTINQEPVVKQQRGSRLPADWVPDKELAEWSKQERPDLELRKVLMEFRDYWIAQPGQKGVKLNWDATWRNWVRNQKAVKQTFAQQAADIARVTVPGSTAPDPALLKIEADRKRAVPPPKNLRDIVASMKGFAK